MADLEMNKLYTSGELNKVY